MNNYIKKLYLKTQDGIKIAINHHITDHDEVLILAHGWFMTKDSKYFSDLANVFSESFDVISMDFRGHGESSGFYTFTSKEPYDMKAVVEYAKEHYKKVYLMGFSLGGALVLIHGATEKNIDKIIAVSAPHSFIKIENHIWKKAAWLTTLKKFELKRWISIRPSLIIGKKTKPIDIVDKIDAPTLFIAGEKDVTVRAWHTMSLYRGAKCKKHFELFKDCNHAEDIFIKERKKFTYLCADWLNDNEKTLKNKAECVLAT